MNYKAYTNKGPRKTNEDSLSIEFKNEEVFVCVADGVGGLEDGEIASQYACEMFKEFYKSDSRTSLKDLVVLIHNNLIERSKVRIDSKYSATTLTLGVIKNNVLKGVHTGDSRVCVLRGNGIKQLTEEHNEVGRLVKEGKISLEDRKNYPRKNIIEGIVGYPDKLIIQEYSFELLPFDRLIFSTDGFHELLSKKQLRDICVRFKSFNEFVRQLEIEIDNRILNDNTSFICLEI